MSREPERQIHIKISLFFYFFFLVFIVLNFSTQVAGLDPNKAITQYKLEKWGEEKGFEQSSVITCVQTPDGYIWLGTLNGLVRFDGMRFQVYNKDNTRQLLANEIKSLYVDHKGCLWIGTRGGGLTYLENGKFSIYSPLQYPALKEITAIYQDQAHTLWLGTFEKGLISLKNHITTVYSTQDGLPGNEIRALAEDAQGNLLIATTSGLAIRSRAGKISVSPYFQEKGKEYQYMISLCVRKNGDLWIGSNMGLCCVSRNTYTQYSIENGLPNSKIKCLFEDSQQNLWGGTDGGGLIRIRTDKIETLASPGGLVDTFVYSICEDKEGSLWLGTLNGGLYRLRDTTATTYTTLEGLSHNSVNCIIEDHQQTLWIGTNGGGLNSINLKNDQIIHQFTHANRLLSNTINALIEDHSYRIWIGTNNGLNYLEDGNIKKLTTQDGLHDNNVLILAEDLNGAIWIRTETGLFLYYNQQIKDFSGFDFTNHNPRFIYKDQHQDFWIGTFGNGIIQCKNSRDFISYTTSEGLIHNEVECAHSDPDGTIYIGTRGGLSRLANHTFTNFTTENGLLETKINFILDDLLGSLWLAGRIGISRVSKKELTDFARGKIKRIHPILYREADGMKTPWCSNGLRTSDGRLWFTSDKGLVVINPIRLKKNTVPPPVVIQEFKVDGELIDTNQNPSGKTFIIPPGKHRLEFLYAGLSFIKPQRIRFKSMLVGYDSEWYNAGEIRSATYTLLSPGTYTFRVIACNSDGVWNNTGASIVFYIKPFFSQTIWFYILLIFLTIIVIFAGYSFRVRQLRLREKILTALVAQRTEELETSKRIIEQKNQSILSSIKYASSIQDTILLTPERFNVAPQDWFILFKPRDIISGDFCWTFQKENILYLAAVDCTGHGVPGALLSMIGCLTLNDIASSQSISDPAQLLFRLHLRVRAALKQEIKETKTHDGMDIALCMIDLEKKEITFAGAKRPLYYITNSQLFEIKGDKKPIGGHQPEKHRTFVNHPVPFQDEITLYLTTDGFADQNNAKDLKYGSPALRDFLFANSHLSMAMQHQKLAAELKFFQGSEEQRDDITIIGFKFKK